MTDSENLIYLLSRKTKLVAMVAPSFPIMYGYPQIVTILKKLGFEHVVEVAAGAKETNREVVEVLKANPTARFITSPCASFVRFIRTKHPEFVKYLAFKADSPMVATAKIVNEKYPGYKPVFIGPCIVKKREASEDYPELDILVLNYKELNQVMQALNIGEVEANPEDKFEISEASTRMYPTDGGLTNSSGLRSILKDEEIRIVSGWKNCEAVLQEFNENPKIRFVDVLFCEGGCINGPGVDSKLTLEERTQKVKEFAMSGA